MDTPRLDAATRGETRYHGKPCKRCGGTERYTSSGNCVACSRQAVKKARQRVKELLANRGATDD